MELHRIENFKLKIVAKTGDKGGREETITQDVVAVKDFGRTGDWVVD